MRVNRDQRIRDPIHNLVSFAHSRDEDRLLWDLLQTRPVQRLRRIKQLGFSEFVYPGATHTRFSHVVGAMQMARRMLDVFEGNAGFDRSNEHHLKKKATLAAALLHDVGHGPYSHVFEDICTATGAEKRHEIYTQEIIALPEIRRLLEEHGVYDETARFFTKEPGYDAYTRIISSQMDCDRLDFLVRDRYHTGIRSSEVDLDWLFDSLRIEEVTLDPKAGVKEFSFVVLPKGVSAVEDFITAYSKMYQNIYFHKSTRAVQHLVKNAIIALLRTEVRDSDPIAQHPLLKFIRSSHRDANDYLRLDDTSVISLLHLAADGKYGEATTLAERFFERNVYKCIDLTSTPHKLSRFVDALNTERIWHEIDVLEPKHYKQYAILEPNFVKNILVKEGDDFRPLGELSSIALTLPPKGVRVYFADSKDRDRARAILVGL